MVVIVLVLESAHQMHQHIPVVVMAAVFSSSSNIILVVMLTPHLFHQHMWTQAISQDLMLHSGRLITLHKLKPARNRSSLLSYMELQLHSRHSSSMARTEHLLNHMEDARMTADDIKEEGFWFQFKYGIIIELIIPLL